MATGVFLLLAASGALRVRRAPEAEQCPDASALSAMIVSLTPKAPVPPPASADESFDVQFSRSDGRYRAVLRIRGGGHDGVRTLEDRGAGCGSLAEATALTIAVIVDPDGVSRSEVPDGAPSEPPVAQLPAAPPAPPRELPPPMAAPPRSWSASVLATAGVAGGVVREAAPVVGASFALAPDRRLSFDAGALFIPTQSLPLERGSVDVWLLAAAANACAFPYAATVRVGACLGILAGATRGEGRGYPVASGVTRPWFAAAATAAADGPIYASLGWTARAGVVVPTHRESFAIEGAGVAYEAAQVAGMAAIGLALTIP